MEDENDLGYDELFKSLQDIIEPPKKTPKYSGMGTLASQMTSTYRGENTGFGQSKFDEGMNWDVSVDDSDVQGSINEYRAQNQGWGSKAAAGIARTGVKAALEVAKMPGYLVGAAGAIVAKEGEGWETAVNNGWVKAINNLNEDINTDVLPVYVKKAVEEGNLWDNISSVDFWATDGADGIGFIASMLVPGAVFKTLGLGQKAMGMTAKGLSMVKGESKLAGAVRTLGDGLKAEQFDVAGTAMANTYMEASAEAGGAMENFEEQKDKFIENQFNSYVNQGLTFEEANIKAEEDFKTQKATLGRDVFVSNVAILAVPNMIQSKMIWGKAGGKALTAIEEPSVLAKIGNRGKNVLGATISEGFVEEGGQSTVENMFTNKAKQNKLKTDDINFTIGELADNYLDTISSTDGQKAMFLGAFLGGGMSAYHGAKSDITDRKQTNELLTLTDSEVNNFNKIVETDTYKRDTNGDIVYNYNNQPQHDPVKVVEMAKALQFTEQENARFEKAVQDGNIDVVDEIKERAVTQLITPFITQGEMGIQALEQYLTESQKAEDIAPEDKAKSKERTKEVIEQAKYMQTQYQNYQDFSRNLINLDTSKGSKEEITAQYNKLADIYINLKGNEFAQNKKLQKLNKQRQELLNDIGKQNDIIPEINPDFIEGTTEDIYKNKREEVDPRIKLLNDKIEATENNLKLIDKVVNEEIWNADKVNKAYDKKLRENKQIRDKEAEQAKLESVIEEINAPTTVSTEQVKEIVDNNPDVVSNPVVANIINKKIDEINTQESIDEFDKKQDKHDDNALEQDINPTTGVNPEVVNNTDNSLDEGTQSIEDSQTEEVDENDNVIYVDPKDYETIEDSSKNQGAARIISTYQSTGEPIKGLESFVEYERTSRDKTKDKVTFGLGDITNLEIEDIYSKFQNNENLSKQDILDLENNLPIKVILSNKDTSASSFLDAMTSKSPEIVARETLPLRKAIVAALIANKGSFEGIEGKVDKQFPGQLKMDVMVSAKNDIKSLDVFKGMTEDQKITYFQNNTVYTNWKGETLSTKTGEVVDGPQFVKGNPQSHKGEVFLKVPMNNSKPFWLKLNVNTLSEQKANSLFELMLIKFQLSNEPSIDELEQYLITNDYTELLYSIQDEINLIKTNEPLRIDRTVNKLIDILIHNGNQNIKTKFNIDFTGSQVEVGTLFGKLNDTPDVHTITAEQLTADPEFYRPQFIKFFQYKRQNVLFKHGDSASFNTKDYVKYLLNESNPVLTTNAIVNEPTFQGYSNIYLNQNVTNNGQVISQITQPEKVDAFGKDNPTLLGAIDTTEIDDMLTKVNEEPLTIKSKRQELLDEFESIKETRDYSTRLVKMVQSSNGKLTLADVRLGAEYIIDKMIEYSLPIEGNEIKKDC